MLVACLGGFKTLISMTHVWAGVLVGLTVALGGVISTSTSLTEMMLVAVWGRVWLLLISALGGLMFWADGVVW